MISNNKLSRFVDSAKLLYATECPTLTQIRCTEFLLENTESPVAMAYIENLYNAAITKSHIKFDDIEPSAGDITAYLGYQNMIDVLNNIRSLATEQKSLEVIKYIDIISLAIGHIRSLHEVYKRGFMLKNQFLIMNYCSMVYTTIEATTTLLYEFIDYVKNPKMERIEIHIHNTRGRANLFFIQQLQKFNDIADSPDFQKTLESIGNRSASAFTGAEVLIGVTASAVVLGSIVPITREIIYQFYNCRRLLSNSLDQQAKFLELNRAMLESNPEFTADKKKAVLKKQEAIKNALLRLSDRIRVDHVTSLRNGKNSIKKDNGLLTLDNAKASVANEPMVLA